MLAAVAAATMTITACGSGDDGAQVQTPASATGAPVSAAVAPVSATVAPASAEATPRDAAPTSTSYSESVTPADGAPNSAPITSPNTTPTAAVPDSLQFSVPLVGGGELDGSALAGKPVAFWFWAPT